MLKKVITANLNSENLINTTPPTDVDINKKAELLEKAKTQVAAKEEKAKHDDQTKSESTN